LLEHQKSGARIFVIKNPDENKVFNITFRTPPNDNTGLPHILEHAVLCGSRKYPIKDPFVELAKGSLNTYLNASTYSDKTMYPVASCNDKDFRNLMDVYLDAVFYPNIYRDVRIFKQEGWHYELDSLDGELIYNGVVYNEMKGALSSPDTVLFNEIQYSLFPNHPYSFDSGGDPDSIPNLNLQKLLDFHKVYYHPSNAYIYLYGDMDMKEQLEWLDKSYLNQFDKIQVYSELKLVNSFEKPTNVCKQYAISSLQSLDKKTYLSYNVVLEKPKNLEESLALEILDYLLIDANGAPLKEAILELDIAEEVFSSFNNDLRQPIYSVVAKNANVEDSDTFIDTINKTLENIVEKGIPSRRLEAVLNRFEFDVKEADFGGYPKGFAYSKSLFETWIYDADPFETFQFEESFSKLRMKIKDNYFSNLIQNGFLKNNHRNILNLVPSETLLQEKEITVKNKLKAFKKSLTLKEKNQLIEDTKALKKYQSEPDSLEKLKTLPLLELDDIKKEPKYITYDVLEENTTKYILHKGDTNRILYGTLLFDLSYMQLDDISWVSLLVDLLGDFDTKNYTYSELSDEINLKTGDISFDLGLYDKANNPNVCIPKFEVEFKCLENQVEDTLRLIHEILKNSLWKDTQRLSHLISEINSQLAISLVESGDTFGSIRSASYHTISGKYNDGIHGIDYYKFIDELCKHKKYTGVLDRLESILKHILKSENSCVLINSEQAIIEAVQPKISKFMNEFDEKNMLKEFSKSYFRSLNEGFKTASQVQYCSLTGDFSKEGYKFNGHMNVLQTIVSLDYLWTQVRIKGGAYGCSASFKRNGIFYLSSYRDPNLSKTYEIYNELPNYIKNLQLNKRELTKYIIGTISDLDSPLTPKMMGEEALSSFLCGISNEDIIKERDEILNVQLSDLNSLGVLIELLVKQNHKCVIGNETTVEEEKKVFNTTENLFN